MSIIQVLLLHFYDDCFQVGEERLFALLPCALLPGPMWNGGRNQGAVEKAQESADGARPGRGITHPAETLPLTWMPGATTITRSHVDPSQSQGFSVFPQFLPASHIKVMSSRLPLTLFSFVLPLISQVPLTQSLLTQPLLAQEARPRAPCGHPGQFPMVEVNTGERSRLEEKKDWVGRQPLNWIQGCLGPP